MNMVWRAEESPLYKSVEQFNRSAPTHKKEPEYRAKPEVPPDTANSSGMGAFSPGPERCRTNPETPPSHDTAPKQCGQTNKSFLSRIAGDKDFLLIAALIFLLWHEKADFKLIAALAYVLLG